MSDATPPSDSVSRADDPADADLRPGTDDCYKCTSCDASCPVAEVDDDFPGPKFQGPEQWRLQRQEDADIDPSISKCSNCMRCDSACPSGVSLSQMHNTARAKYVDESMSKWSLEYWRNRALANYGRLAPVASAMPRLANAAANNTVLRALGEKLFGVTAERELPDFAHETFREWWGKRGGNRVESEEKRVAYFHGCYANYNTPEVAKAFVRVFEAFGYEVAVPEQRCSGTPIFANGMMDDAERAAEHNVRTLRDLVDDGYDVVTSCTSCSMSLRQEYPELFDYAGTETVAASTSEALEYLRFEADLDRRLADADVDESLAADLEAEFGDLAYHAPCHARNQGLAGQSVELLSTLDGVDPHDVGDSCSGISGTYGWKAENYETSMEIGAEMFDHMERVEGETGMTECPTCAMQMEHGTGYDVKHPLEVLEAVFAPDAA
ncbi:anaerobic glycerol-3-phosphate dehydrogenase subunit C [Halocalculus aciditolerans]|uniref:sn-glycerol-3-phosphate dehydrogenase subunit C n=1 Tax=Halocalculus aciditolerans TaxID=1383812 RepID=A0A830FM80_9EURY|nr:anaerobic glycerol-3-phosphate dehydrogenase subunit C [Halocalculus aciditolerans]GGL66488.1 sn-glycerol-3-phosphate dehydrogenase subunit C [Halocalculus aciditolerans]